MLFRVGPAVTLSMTPIAMEAAEMAKYAGSYTNPPARIDVTVREGKLYFRRGAQEDEATKVGDLRFAVTPPPPAGTPQTFTLVPGADGAIGFLHMGSRALKRIPTKAS